MDRSILRRTALLLCAAVCVVTGSLWCRDVLRGRRERSANNALARQVHDAETQLALKDVSLSSDLGEGGVLPQYQALLEQNPDLAGWLSIPDTVVDYPVMYTPEEPEYYLRRGFDGNYAVSGSLFIGEGCVPEGPHVIIYGHYMRDGTMFGTLAGYAEESYQQAHPTISFHTLTEMGEYEVMAAFYSRIYGPDEGDEVFRYYEYEDLSQQERFEEYVRQVKGAALYDTGVEAQFGDRLVTLSTCSYHTEDGRFVVVARRRA